jgi:hypothetical protein
VLGALFTLMAARTDLVVHGEVSPSLLRNLEEYQAMWVCWAPAQYHRVDVRGESEREQRGAPGGHAVAAFSGGVDSCFTAWRHTRGECGRLKRDLRAALMVHGFDIPLGEPETFARAFERSRIILTSVGVPLIPMATNLRELPGDWDHVFGIAGASCLMMLQGAYSAGLFGSSEPYHMQIFPWGSTPMSDWLLSSDSFQFVHDGAAFTRVEKLQALTSWPEACRHLRVCWQGERKDRNCGRCEKCIRTILAFRAVGLESTEAFEADVRDADIIGLRGLTEMHCQELLAVILAARAASIREPWVEAVERLLRQSRWRRRFASQLTDPARAAAERLARIPLLWRVARRLQRRFGVA